MTDFRSHFFFVFNAMAAKLCKEQYHCGKYFGGGGN